MVAGVSHVYPAVAVCGNALRGGEVTKSLPLAAKLPDEVTIGVEDVDTVLPFICGRTSY